MRLHMGTSWHVKPLVDWALLVFLVSVFPIVCVHLFVTASECVSHCVHLFGFLSGTLCLLTSAD